jgi:endonuclease/exonuclease/phosphatase family metal-dependent hydrolase
MKKNNILWLAFILILSSCGGDDSPNPTPPPTEPEESPYEACLPTVTETTLEVVTWNIERFPIVSSAVESVAEIINDTNPDIIAVQEITTEEDFNDLINRLEGWSGVAVQYNGGNTRLGYLYKDAEVSLIGQAEFLFEESNSEYNNAFTAYRRPYYAKFQHVSGISVDLINIHLKCCDGSENRRRNASGLLKDYIDNNLSNEEVILLGDFNDEIVDEDDNVFQNFIDDAENYIFSTMTIAEGDEANWSFPSWPSQIDQILITDELFDKVMETKVLKLEACNSDFPNLISDHRPVLIRISGN